MTLELLVEEIRKTRRQLLLSDCEAGLSPLANAHLILALDALSTAATQLEIAALFQAQALAESGQ